MDGHRVSGARRIWERYKPRKEDSLPTVQEPRNTTVQQLPSGSDVTTASHSTYSQASGDSLSQQSTSGSYTPSSMSSFTLQNSYGMQNPLSSSRSHNPSLGGPSSSQGSYEMSGQVATGSSTAMPDPHSMTSDPSSSWDSIGPRRHQATPDGGRHGGAHKPSKNF